MPDPNKYVLREPHRASDAIGNLMVKIRNGWRPSEDLLKLSEYRAAHSLGIYIWEWRNLVLPALGEKS